MYRVTKKRRDELARMREAKAEKRLVGPIPERPPELPDLRRRLIVESFDFGHQSHVLEFYKTNRVDCFRVLVDGKEWKKRIGWSKALEGLRKSVPRVSAQID